MRQCLELKPALRVDKSGCGYPQEYPKMQSLFCFALGVMAFAMISTTANRNPRRVHASTRVL